MDPRLSYNFDEIEASVRQEIHTASARFNAALQELRAQVAPLQELWTREAATAYQVEQVKWHQAATALNEILVDLEKRYGTALMTLQLRIAERPACGPGRDADPTKDSARFRR